MDGYVKGESRQRRILFFFQNYTAVETVSILKPYFTYTPSIITTMQATGPGDDLPFNIEEALGEVIGPTQHEGGYLEPLEPLGQLEALEPLFPKLPRELITPRISYIEEVVEDKKFGANVSPDFARGPGVNLEKYKRANSFCPGHDTNNTLEAIEQSKRAHSAPVLTGDVPMAASMDMDTCNLSDKIKNIKKDVNETKYKIPKFGVGRRGSRESRSKTKASRSSKVAKVSKPRSLSPNQKFWGNGKTKLDALRGMYPTHVRGVVEATEFDSRAYSGVVKVDFRGRLDVNDSVGLNVAKNFPQIGDDGGTVIVPGKVVGQKHTKGKLDGVKYRIIYLNGTEETVNEEMLRYHASVFNSACMSTDVPLLPIIVRMM